MRSTPFAVERRLIDGIPAISVRPAAASSNRLVVWLPPLGESAEAMVPHLQRLAATGVTALSIDPWQHGMRQAAPSGALRAAVLADFRRRMWPILGRTTIDALTVVDHWGPMLGTDPTSYDVGGMSMGGDIALALAALDARIGRVSVVAAGPDWGRPGMRSVDGSDKTIDQGLEDAGAHWWRQQLEPATRAAAFARDVHVDLELGGADTHVPPDAALELRRRVVALDPSAATRFSCHVHPALDHLAVLADQAVIERALSRLGGASPLQ
ncbi:hypothetical protein GXB85_15745 [Cellulomonas sp. APG4]|uniref:hypothetical protein n=1 Tax=Cellulomonas sp. APG4 TaxID=1538656 RepID=UPI001379B068|nr:hypothetical protein [Cellulomonas sp. APG4]NCT92390.1 hypothetical protein [Cellulomonas sp. APG4]